MNDSAVAAFIALMLSVTTPLLLAGMGGLFSEVSGVLNLGLEGMMLAGSFFAYIVALYGHSVLLGLFAALVAGGLFGLLHAWICISLRADQIVSAVGINLLALGLTSSLYSVMFDNQLSNLTSPGLSALRIPILEKIPILGPSLFSSEPLVYLALLLVPAAQLVLGHTHYGLWVRTIGEHPQAAAAAGIHVPRVRYVAVTVSGMLAGLGGASLTVTGINLFTDDITNGRGYLAFAAIVFGKWTALGTLLGTLLFGAGNAAQLFMQTYGVRVPVQLLEMLPYVLSLVALYAVRTRGRAPAMSGRPWAREEG